MQESQLTPVDETVHGSVMEKNHTVTGRHMDYETAGVCERRERMPTDGEEGEIRGGKRGLTLVMRHRTRLTSQTHGDQQQQRRRR